MRQALRRRKSFFTVNFQHSLQKLQGRRVLLAVLRPCQVELEFLIFLENRLGVFSLEEVTAHQQNMENHPSGEDVRFWCQFLFMGGKDDIGREVAGRAAFVCAVIFLPGIDGESEVDDNRLERAGITDHNVLQFDVPVDHFFPLQLKQSFHDSPHDGPNFFDGELSPPSVQILEQVPSAKHLPDNVVAIVSLIDPLQAHEVRMLQIPQDFQLVLETVEFLGIRTQQLLAENLGRQSLPVLQPQDLINGGSCSTAQLADRLEICMETRLTQLSTEHAKPNPSEFCELDEERESDATLVRQSEPLESTLRQRLLCGFIGSGQYLLKGERQSQTDSHNRAFLFILGAVQQDVFIFEAHLAGCPLLGFHFGHGLQYRFSIIERDEQLGGDWLDERCLAGELGQHSECFYFQIIKLYEMFGLYCRRISTDHYRI